MDKTFYVDLVSNASMGVYPNNTLSSFTNMMNSPIELNEPYEVALNEIIYPLDFDQSIEIKYNYVSIQKMPKLRKVFEGPDLTFEYQGPLKIKDILPAFNRTNEANISKINFVDGKRNKLTIVHRPRVEYDEKDDRDTSEVGQLSDGKTLMIYFQDDDFVVPLGFEYNAYNKFLDKANRADKFKAKNPPQFSCRSNLLFVDSDIIEGHRVGDSMSMNLRTVPLSKGLFENVQYMSFTNEYFFPVRLNRIERISIKITDENGANIKFKTGRVFITLKFRPRLYKP